MSTPNILLFCEKIESKSPKTYGQSSLLNQFKKCAVPTFIGHLESQLFLFSTNHQGCDRQFVELFPALNYHESPIILNLSCFILLK